MREHRDFEWGDLVKIRDSVDDLSVMIAHLDMVLAQQIRDNHPSFGAIIRRFLKLAFLMNQSLITCQKEIYEVLTEALEKTKLTEQ
jgi:hypothetical protein